MSEQTKDVLEEAFLISSADVDFTRTLKLSSLTNFLIQAAWKHAEVLGFGMDFMHTNKLVWVLSRLQIKLTERPYWNKGIKVITWPKGIHRLYYLRDMEVLDNEGNCFARATTQWLIINTSTKRPKLYKPEANIFSKNLNKHAINKIDLSVELPNGKPVESNFSPFYSDIDLNQHLTTTSYVDWMMNCFRLDELADKHLGEIKLIFLKEIPFGTRVKVRRYFDEQKNRHCFHFLSDDDKVSFFKGEIVES